MSNRSATRALNRLYGKEASGRPDLMGVRRRVSISRLEQALVRFDGVYCDSDIVKGLRDRG
jgi:hypothetical protein